MKSFLTKIRSLLLDLLRQASPARPALKRAVQTFPKPVLFALMGAFGCLLGACFGEGLLWATEGGKRGGGHRICLLVDCSGSMNQGSLDEVKSAALGFIDNQDLSANQIGIVGFNSDAWQASPLTRSRTELETSIRSLRARGGTAMHIGLREALAQLGENETFKEIAASRAILLFTDGEPNDQDATKKEAQVVRDRGVTFVAVASNGADLRYLSALTGDSSRVVAANSGHFSDAFKKADTVIRSAQMVESTRRGGQESFGWGMARVSAWTALLSLGLGMFLILGQNVYLQRRMPEGRAVFSGLAGSSGAGLVAGLISQVFFWSAVKVNAPDVLFRVMAWSILGGITGRADRLLRSQP